MPSVKCAFTGLVQASRFGEIVSFRIALKEERHLLVVCQARFVSSRLLVRFQRLRNLGRSRLLRHNRQRHFPFKCYPFLRFLPLRNL